MELMKTMTAAQLMSQQSGEEIATEDVIKLPSKTREDEFEAYVARSDNHVCVVQMYKNGSVHVYIH